MGNIETNTGGHARPMPNTVQWGRSRMAFLVVSHILAGMGLYYLSCAPSMWIDVIQLISMYYMSGLFGLALGVHRYFTHKSFCTTGYIEAFMVLCNTFCNQGSIISWCRDHRTHHRCQDTPGDPYGVHQGFFYAHIGWMYTKRTEAQRKALLETNVSDLRANWLLQLQERFYIPLATFFCYLVPMGYAHQTKGDAVYGLLVYGFLRWAITLHATACVNSFAHFYGSRPHKKTLSARNNVSVSIVACGEGFHNWHHAFPNDAYAMKGDLMELICNVTTIVIIVMETLGVVWGLKRPEQFILEDLQKELLLRAPNHDNAYNATIVSPSVLRTWFLDEPDPMSGLAQVHRHNRITVDGDFTVFIDDLLLSARTHMSQTWRWRTNIATRLWLCKKETYTANIVPFQSTLPKHCIERDKAAVAYHYDTGNKFFASFLSANMLYTTGVWEENAANTLDDACENKFKVALALLVNYGFCPAKSTLLDVGCGWGGSVAYFTKNGVNQVNGITISQSQVRYANTENVIYRHFKEETRQFDGITAFQCTEHMPYDQLLVFFEWIDQHLSPGGVVLIEFMTTTKTAKCHPFFDQYIFPDGAQFPLADAIRAAERNKNLMLQRVMDNTTDYYRTIRCWIANLEMQKNICLAALPVPSEASERYNDFVFYLKWAEFLYKTGRSRCYTCVWTKKK